MVCDKVFTGPRKLIGVGAFAAIAVGGLVAFLIEVIWFSRLSPWGSHAFGTGKTVYTGLAAAFVFALVSCILAIAIIVMVMFLPDLFTKITTNAIVQYVVFAIVAIITIVSLALGINVGQYGASNSNFTDKCATYAQSVSDGTRNYALKDPSKTLEIEEWIHKIVEKSFKKDFADLDFTKTSLLNGYLCQDVGASTIAFCVLQLVGLILFIVLIILEFVKPTTD